MKKVLMVIMVLALITAVAFSYAEVAVEEPTPEPAAESAAENAVLKIEQSTPVFTYDLTGIILAVLTLLFSIAAKFIYPALELERNKRIARVAIFAAEQLYQTGVIQDRLKYVEEYLYSKGIKVDTRLLIESVVGEINKYKQEIDYGSSLKEYLTEKDEEFHDGKDQEDLDLREGETVAEEE